jgi:hypothetical protein
MTQVCPKAMQSQPLAIEGGRCSAYIFSQLACLTLDISGRRLRPFTGAHIAAQFTAYLLAGSGCREPTDCPAEHTSDQESGQDLTNTNVSVIFVALSPHHSLLKDSPGFAGA